MHRIRRGTAAIAVVAATVLALTGCIMPPPTMPSGAGPTGEPQWAPTGEQVAPELEPFYGQQVDWTDCGTNWCGTVAAPMDWGNPATDSIELAVTVAPATGKRHGAILFNPGGPGGSGVEFVQGYADYLLAPEVREHYDLVGFDPRGVGSSTPISCYDDPAELYDWLWEIPPGPAPEPLSDEELTEQFESAQWFADSCLEHTGPLLEFVGTEQVAADLDLLRALLGEQQLNYLGTSYGTLIGSTYADLFPERVGRMVLDAAIAPDATDFEGTLHQAAGFELAYGNFVADCVQRQDCPFDGSAADALAETRALMARVKADPIPVADGRELGSGGLHIAIAASLYNEGRWQGLRQILADVEAGRGESAFAAADDYYSINPDRTFGDNSLEALLAVNCLDQPAVTDFDEVRANAERIMAAAPTLGPGFVGLSTCAAWPFEATRTPHEITAPGAEPIIVIGGRNDPATSYQQAVDLAEMLESGVLISVAAEGHGQYNNGNGCVDRPVNEYFLSGTPPAGDLDC